MRFLPFVVFIFLILIGLASFSDDLSTTNNTHNNTYDNNTGLTYQFRFLNKRPFDNLALVAPENLKSRLLFDNPTLTNTNFDWLRWVESAGNVESRPLLGGFPFLSVKVENGQDSAYFSVHNFLFLMYFNKRF